MEEKAVIRRFIFEEVASGIKSDSWNDDESLLGSGVIDSVSMLRLLTFMEERFKIKISDDELIPENFETINTICKLIGKKIHLE